MIRESMDSNAGYIHLGRIPTSSFSGYVWRTLASGNQTGVPSFTGAVRWVRLVRRGNRVTAYHAPDVSGNPGTWAQLGQPQTIIMSTPVLVGFAVDNAGGTAGVLNTATFTNLTIVQLNNAPTIDLSALPSSVIAPPTTANLDATVTDDGNPTPTSLTTTWSKAVGPGSVTFGDTSAVDTSASFSQFGTYTLRLQADDTGVIAFRDKAVTFYESQFQQWQAQNFGGDPNAANAAPDADPDGDGLNNFGEFAFNLHGLVADAAPWTLDSMTDNGQTYLRLTIPKNPAATHVLYEVQATSNLADPESWSSAGLSIDQDTDTILSVHDSMPVNAATGHRFLRAKVSQ
jgi:hypothetical protein